MTPEAPQPKGDSGMLKVLRDHAWDYFELHAEQRLKTFHFYILLETGLIAGLVVATRTGLPDVETATVVGLMMAFFSFIFWKLDYRTKGMIKVSEEALKLCERRMFEDSEDKELAGASPFLNEPQAKGHVGLSPFGTLSYSKCFGAVFIAFASLGLAITIPFWLGVLKKVLALLPK